METDRQLLIIEKAADRDELAMILARNDYTVRQVKMKKTGTSASYVRGIEYWREK